MKEWFIDLIPAMIIMYILLQLMAFKMHFEDKGNYTIYDFTGFTIAFIIMWLLGCYFLDKTI